MPFAMPYVFTNNVSVVDAVTTDANNSYLLSLATTIGPTQVSSIYASSIIPTTPAQATFGGTQGYIISPGVAGQTPLSLLSATSASVGSFVVKGGAGQTAPAIQVTMASASAGAFGFQLTLASAANTPGIQVNAGTSMSSAAVQVNMGSSQSAPGVLINGAALITGNPFEIDATPGGTKLAWLTSAGAFNVGSTSTASAAGAIGAQSLLIGANLTISNAGAVVTNQGQATAQVAYTASVSGVDASVGALRWGSSTNGSFSYLYANSSNQAGTSGINATAMGIGNGSTLAANLALAINNSANVGIAGSTYAISSSRAIKKSIQPLAFDGLALLKKAPPQSWRLIHEDDDAPLSAGPIAEELDAPIRIGDAGIGYTAYLAALHDAVLKLAAHVGV